jgi:hypothetical protein
VATLVVLVPASDAAPSLQQAAVSELARLGVTSVTLPRDDHIVGFVVEGWAFDPSRSAQTAVAAVAGGSSRARTLLPLLDLAVSTAPLPPGGDGL